MVDSSETASNDRTDQDRSGGVEDLRAARDRFRIALTTAAAGRLRPDQARPERGRTVVRERRDGGFSRLDPGALTTA